MLEKVKTALRRTRTVLDEEIADIIEACKADLRLAGVVNLHEDDPLIIRAVILYAKANFGYDDNSTKYAKEYAYLKCVLKTAGDYNGKME